MEGSTGLVWQDCLGLNRVGEAFEIRLGVCLVHCNCIFRFCHAPCTAGSSPPFEKCNSHSTTIVVHSVPHQKFSLACPPKASSCRLSSPGQAADCKSQAPSLVSSSHFQLLASLRNVSSPVLDVLVWAVLAWPKKIGSLGQSAAPIWGLTLSQIARVVRAALAVLAPMWAPTRCAVG